MDAQDHSKAKEKVCGCPFCDVPVCPDSREETAVCATHKVKIHLLDCLGLYCPVPVMRAKEEIDGLEPGALMEIVADDPAAEADIPSWARRTGNELLRSWKDGEEFHFLVMKKKEA